MIRPKKLNDNTLSARSLERSGARGYFRKRMDAVCALSAYAKLQNKSVLDSLRLALGDAKHKIRHAAARALGIPCPGCTET